jgi:hypothetical protein
MHTALVSPVMGCRGASGVQVVLSPMQTNGESLSCFENRRRAQQSIMATLRSPYATRPRLGRRIELIRFG